MSDYISREQALAEVEELKKIHFDRAFVLSKVSDRIEQIPSADVRENIHGEWEEVTDYKDDNVYQWHIICSVCRQRGMFESDKFCPNCGADMRGET